MIWSDQEIKLLLTTRIFYTDVMNELFFLRESQATINIVIHLFGIHLNAALRISFFFFFLYIWPHLPHGLVGRVGARRKAF